MAATAAAAEIARPALSLVSSNKQSAEFECTSVTVLAFATSVEPFPEFPISRISPQFDEKQFKAWRNNLVDELYAAAIARGRVLYDEALEIVQYFRVGNFTEARLQRFREIASVVQRKRYRAEDVLEFLEVEQPLFNELLLRVWGLKPEAERLTFATGGNPAIALRK